MVLMRADVVAVQYLVSEELELWKEKVCDVTRGLWKGAEEPWDTAPPGRWGAECCRRCVGSGGLTEAAADSSSQTQPGTHCAM